MAAADARPGVPVWTELWTQDVEGDVAFHETVLGVRFSDEAEDAGYRVGLVEGEPKFGVTGIPPELPADAPSQWITFFHVEDVEAAVQRVVAKGGSILIPVVTNTDGVFAACTAPDGAAFGLCHAR